MLISVENFKSIEQVVAVDISNLTVLAGVNSSGKSSLIQALLLLKQTLNFSSNEMLCLNGPYVYADSLFDLMHNKKLGNMKFVLSLTEKELSGLGTSFPYAVDSIEISVSFRVRSDSYVLSEFRINLISDDFLRGGFSIVRRARKPTYDVYADSSEIKDVELDNYSFANFFPIFANKDGNTYKFGLVKAVRDMLVAYFDKIVYIAPLRVAPVLARTYQTDVETKYVLPDGENTRFILDKMSGDRERLNLVKEWLCNRFRLAKDIKVVKESGELYRVVVTSNEDVKVDLMHMGFGLSQILPIITQGCISSPNSLLIVEDPDVHMHPSIQAAMADFFIFLCRDRHVSVLVETHSDHFITRIRRRIAEKEMPFSDVHLIFVINEFGSSIYKSILLSDGGRLEGSMPPGFLDTRDSDFKAILEANRR